VSFRRGQVENLQELQMKPFITDEKETLQWSSA